MKEFFTTLADDYKEDPIPVVLYSLFIIFVLLGSVYFLLNILKFGIATIVIIASLLAPHPIISAFVAGILGMVVTVTMIILYGLYKIIRKN